MAPETHHLNIAMTTTLRQSIQQLSSLGVSFLVSHNAPGGQCTVYVTGDQLGDYAEDPDGWLAAHYGVARDDYLAWQAAKFVMLCGATTSKGRPCEHVARNGNGVMPKQWVAVSGARCAVHEESEGKRGR
jgi:hypothetical protein